ncbi:hypothetical protein LZ016_10815 [Sphingomonas sp. SM33]|uniref:DUF4239 domain-containing protein n=1 Tax=Sphingomonas telluris TaxID=2907998 RepID=A0ABS9VNN2_9SPHN|nr:hypothetical protein [Sphingomonas telluris]MCH8616589.1 hypothetical protein [Sphingomonas telluris]
MLSDWLSSLSIIGTGAVTLAVLVGAAAVGQFFRRLQARRTAGAEKESEPSVAQEGYLLGSALGLLGLLLAFTFGMVINRYEARRELVTTEANAIGTAYLRAQLLDEPHRSRLSNLLVAYTENRIDLATAADPNAFLATNDRLLTEIWAAVSSARESALAHGISTPLLMTFNEVIDLDTERKIAWQLRVPAEVLLLLLVFLAVAATLVGHQIDGPRGRRAAVVLFLLLAVSITVITDINRPMTGSAKESQQAMRMLLASLKAQPPRVFDQFKATQPAAQPSHAH